MWQKIFFNTQNIESDKGNACLIKMPNRSKYIGYSFWHPKKLVREHGGKGYHSTFSFTEEWIFKLKKYGQGRWNRFDVISEIEIDVGEMMDAFGVVNEKVNLSVEQETDKINLENVEKTVVEHHKPEKVQPVENNIINELINNHE